MDHCPSPRLGSSEHLRQIFATAYRDRVPMSGAFDLTYRCNFRCVHCYVGHLVAQRPSEARELETAQIVDLLSQAAGAGCLMLVLSGGEPLLREDFVEIYVAAKQLGMIVTVFTNAGLVSEEHLQAFEEYPPHEVEVSLYGTDEASYERVTGQRGAYRRVRRGIERLLEGGVSVNLKTMILQSNMGNVGAIQRLAEELGLRFRMDPLVTPRLDGDPSPLAQRVDPRTAIEIEMGLDDYREALTRFYREQCLAVDQIAAPSDRRYLCGAGTASFHVDPRGLLHPCLVSRGIESDALAMGFEGAWQAVAKAVDEAVWEGVSRCAGCRNTLLCGYCPGLFDLEGASVSRPPSYVCGLGESRHQVVSCKEAEVVGARAE